MKANKVCKNMESNVESIIMQPRKEPLLGSKSKQIFGSPTNPTPPGPGNP